MADGANGLCWTYVRTTSSISSLQSRQKSVWRGKIFQSKRIYEDLEERLSKSRFLAGENYTIADIGTFPWIARHEWHDIGLKNYKNLTRWYVEISEREAVKKGFKFMNKDEVPPKP